MMPSAALLPFLDPALTGDHFEAFCHDLLARTPGFSDVRRWGVSGDAQDGVDLLASHAGGTWAFQCKREAQFGPHKVLDAIRRATHPADQYMLLLGRTATRATRVAAEAVGWKLWDATDLTQRVRALPTESGVQLVRAHFGHAVAACILGIDVELPWTPLGDFFAPFMRPGRLFTHRHALAGRNAELQALAHATASEAWVVVVSGRGGIGKSRLVLEAGRRLEGAGAAVRVVDPDRSVQPEHFEALPSSGSVLLLVDDAHRRDDIAALTRFAERARSAGRGVRLLLTTRPYGLDALRSAIANGGADAADVAVVPSLRDLAADDLRAVAGAALGPDLARDGALVQQLVAAADGSPLVVSLGATLVGQGQINPGHLRGHDDFRRTILDRFQDEAVGAVAATVPPADGLAALRVTAAAGPLNTEAQATVEAAAAVAGLSPAAFRRALGALEAAGVILRHGRQVRISPDVLSDHILTDAALLPDGGSTGFAEEVFEALATHAGPAVLRNLAELDWRRRRANSPTDLLSNTWAAIERAFRHGRAAERVRVLQLVRPAAYYLPARVLALCRLAVRSPVEAGDDVGYEPGQDEVLRELPQLLKHVAYTLDVLPDALDMLWDLAQHERPGLQPYPRAAQDVLVALAKPDMHRTHRVHRVVLDATERWASAQATVLSAWNGDPDALSRFAAARVIAPALDRSVDLSWSDGSAWFIEHGWPRADLPAVQAVRRRALCLLERYGLTAGSAGAMAVVDVLARHLQNASAFRRPTDLAVLHAFESESRWTVVIIARLVSAHKDPHLADLVWQRTGWLAERGLSGLRRRAVQLLRRRIQDVPGWALVRALHRRGDPWVGRRSDDAEGSSGSHSAHDAATRAYQENAARSFLDRELDPHEAAAELTALLGRIDRIDAWVHASAGSRALPQPWAFFSTLARLDPDYGENLSRAIVERGGESCATVAAALTEGARQAGAPADRLLALSRGRAPERGAAAQALHAAFWRGGPTRADWAVLRRLLADATADVQTMAVGAWRGALHHAPDRARTLLTSIVPNTNQAAGAELFAAVEGQLATPLDFSEWRHLLGVAADLPSLDDEAVLAFLRSAAEQDPVAAFDLLASRVGRECGAFRALPLDADVPLFATAPPALQADLLRRAIGLRLDMAPGERAYPASQLVTIVARGFPAPVLDVIAEALAGDAAADVAVGLLRDVPEQLPLNAPDVVRVLLDAAEQGGGPRRREQAEEALQAAARSGMTSRQIGHPNERDVWQRDQGLALAERLAGDTRLRAFYLSLSQAAAASIERDRVDDEERRLR